MFPTGCVTDRLAIHELNEFEPPRLPDAHLTVFTPANMHYFIFLRRFMAFLYADCVLASSVSSQLLNCGGDKVVSESYWDYIGCGSE